MSDAPARTDAVAVSGVVICLNEADRIGRCLESLSFCDEIVVVGIGWVIWMAWWHWSLLVGKV